MTKKCENGQKWPFLHFLKIEKKAQNLGHFDHNFFLKVTQAKKKKAFFYIALNYHMHVLSLEMIDFFKRYRERNGRTNGRTDEQTDKIIPP